MITLEEVGRRVAALATAGAFSPDGHMEEDSIREDVLRAIAQGAKNAQELAAAAIETEKHDFPRWYE